MTAIHRSLLGKDWSIQTDSHTLGRELITTIATSAGTFRVANVHVLPGDQLTIRQKKDTLIRISQALHPDRGHFGFVAELQLP